MATMIAPCGLDCAQCEAYTATQSNDPALLEALAVKWQEAFNSPEITAVTILCDGCMGEGRKIGHCSECEIRACSIERGLLNCAPCQDFGCEKLEAFWKEAPKAKTNLEALRSAM
jgi:hypothetical protein